MVTIINFKKHYSGFLSDTCAGSLQIIQQRQNHFVLLSADDYLLISRGHEVPLNIVDLLSDIISPGMPEQLKALRMSNVGDPISAMNLPELLISGSGFLNN